MSTIARILFTTILLLTVIGSPDAMARKKPGKKATVQAPVSPSDNVVKIRFDLKEMRDSILAAEERVQEELLEQIDSTCQVDRYRLMSTIDDITGFAGLKENKRGRYVVELAKEHLGKPYRLGAEGPREFDCSSLVRYVYREIGMALPRYSADQYAKGRKVEANDLRPGDLVFFGTKKIWSTVGHVGIVVSVDHTNGTFQFIHASTSGGVRISPSTEKYFQLRYIGAKRYIPEGF